MMHLLLEALPLPPHRHAQVRALQEEQSKFLSDAYAAIARKDEFGIKVANAAYERVRVELTAILGENAHAGAVDPDLWQHYSDLHKDLCGWRPRSHMTWAECKRDFDQMVATVNAPDFKWPDEEMA